MEVCLTCGTNFDVRKEWDDILYNFKTFETNDDRSYTRCAYSIHAPFPCADRDFYLE